MIPAVDSVKRQIIPYEKEGIERVCFTTLGIRVTFADGVEVFKSARSRKYTVIYPGMPQTNLSGTPILDKHTQQPAIHEPRKMKPLNFKQMLRDHNLKFVLLVQAAMAQESRLMAWDEQELADLTEFLKEEVRQDSLRAAQAEPTAQD